MSLNNSTAINAILPRVAEQVVGQPEIPGLPAALTPKQVAAGANIGLTKVYDLMKSGALKRIKIGAATRITAESYLRLVQNGSTGADAA